jgi:hypothetical protein
VDESVLSIEHDLGDTLLFDEDFFCGAKNPIRGGYWKGNARTCSIAFEGGQ